MTTTAALPASAASFPSGYHTLTVNNDSLCLDSYGNSSNAGAIIDQWTCNGQTNQEFQFVPISNGYGELQLENSGQDVTVANSSKTQGSPDIVQEPVNGSAASLWLPVAQSNSSYEFQNQNSGLCLDVYGAGSNTGQQLDQWPCKSPGAGTNQAFAVGGTTTTTTTTAPSTTTSTTMPTTTSTTTPTTTSTTSASTTSTSTTSSTTSTTAPSTTTSTTAATTTTTSPSGFPSGYNALTINSDGLCLDSSGDTSNAGAAIDQWTCSGGTNQDFQFVAISNGYGELQVENSGQDVTVANSSTAQGTVDIVQEPVNGSAASLWLPIAQSNGSYEFKNRNSGLCLDVYGASTSAGQQLDQWPCKNAAGTNQDFSIKVAGEGSLVQVQNFGSNPGGDQMYIYVPTSVHADPPLLLALHGCGGTGPGFYQGTQFAQLANQYGFVVLFPTSSEYGGQGPTNYCWDIESSASDTRGGGSDPVSLIQMIDYAEAHYGTNPNRVYVTGWSSGAMMTELLLAEYPDVFKSGVAFAGLPFNCWNAGACLGGNNTLTPQQYGDLVRNADPGFSGTRPTVQVWAGTNDNVIPPSELGDEVEQWTNVFGVSQTPVSTQSPQSSWTLNLYGSSTNPPVESISVAGAGHDVYTASGAQSFAIDFMGLNS